MGPETKQRLKKLDSSIKEYETRIRDIETWMSDFQAELFVKKTTLDRLRKEREELQLISDVHES